MDAEQRLIKIETDLAYMQDTVRELNEIVSAQQAAISRLEGGAAHVHPGGQHIAAQIVP